MGLKKETWKEERNTLTSLSSNLLLVVSIGQTQQEAGEGCSPWDGHPTHTPHTFTHIGRWQPEEGVEWI